MIRIILLDPIDTSLLMRALQSEALPVLSNIWSHPKIQEFPPKFVQTIVNSLGIVLDSLRKSPEPKAPKATISAPDPALVSRLIDMGFSKSRAEHALREV